MIDLKNFRYVNDLKQAEIASYLGVTKSFISQVENGSRLLPPPSLYKLINNNMGWDSSMLSEKDNVNLETNIAASKARYSKSVDTSDEVKELRDRLAEKDAIIADLKAQLERQSKWIDKLLENK